MPETSILEAPSRRNARFRAVSLRGAHAKDASSICATNTHVAAEKVYAVAAATACRPREYLSTDDRAGGAVVSACDPAEWFPDVNGQIPNEYSTRSVRSHRDIQWTEWLGLRDPGMQPSSGQAR